MNFNEEKKKVKLLSRMFRILEHLTFNHHISHDRNHHFAHTYIAQLERLNLEDNPPTPHLNEEDS